MASSKRRTAAQIAADAQAAYRASVAKRHTALVEDMERCAKSAAVARANVAMWEDKGANVRAALADVTAELARIDAAAAALAGGADAPR